GRLAGACWPQAAADLVPGRSGCADCGAAHAPGPGHGRGGDLHVAERRGFINEGEGGRQRVIPGSGPLFAAVVAYLDAERPPGARSYQVFLVHKGPRRAQPLSAKGMEEILIAARRGAARRRAGPGWAGLEHATCHELRHTCLTRLQVSGVAAAASFGRIGECSLPAPQRAGPSRCEGQGWPPVVGELRCHCPGCIRCHNEAPGAVVSDDGMMHQGQRSRAATRRDVHRCVLRTEVFSRVGTLLSTSWEAGMALEAVQAQAGHASIESTRIYLHLADDWLAAQYRKAAEVIDAQVFAGQAAGPGVTTGVVTRGRVRSSTAGQV